MDKLNYHTQAINCVSWNSTGDKLASSGDDKMVAIWKQDETYDYKQETTPTFGENIIFKEKWKPFIKIRGPIAEVNDIEWIHDNKTLIVSSLDGTIGFYSIQRQKLLHSIPINAQFIQGIAIEPIANNLLCVQSTSSTAKVYKIHRSSKANKKINKLGIKSKYSSQQFASLSSYPLNKSEAQQQSIYDQQYKEEKKELKEQEKKEKEEAEKAAKEKETENDNNDNAMEIDKKTENDENKNDSNANKTATKTKKKARKKRVPKFSLFKHNLVTTSRKPGWSPDGMLLCCVAGQSRDKKMDCVHIFHRSDLTKKVTTIGLPQSTHAKVARFNPLKLNIENDNDIDKGSIVDKYKMKYRMLFAIINSSELFIFDTSRTEAIFYWKDSDTQNFLDMEWSFDGKSLLISDVEGFITRIKMNDNDLVTM